jgi:hypothetical protein
MRRQNKNTIIRAKRGKGGQFDLRIINIIGINHNICKNQGQGQQNGFPADWEKFRFNELSHGTRVLRLSYMSCELLFNY